MLKTNQNEHYIRILQDHLLSWFNTEKRELPFRKTKNPYFIWISEIMAQQTQIDTLIPYYNQFIANFPTVEALASASEDAVIKAWEGLGYYSRARNLHKAAKMIVNEFNGVFPETFKSLVTLPGIGPYTGGAIASIAFNERVSAVDGNVLRVISRYCNSFDDIGEEKTKKKVTQWVEEILPETTGDFNEALMELGALICSPKNPKCIICPIQTGCQAFFYKNTEAIPVKKKKQKQIRKKMEVGFLKSGNAFYFMKRPKSGLLSEMWSFPIVEEHLGNGEDIKKNLLEIFPELCTPVYIGESRHVFSHIIWEMKVYLFETSSEISDRISESQDSYPTNERDHIFKALSAIDDLALPVAFSKLVSLFY